MLYRNRWSLLVVGLILVFGFAFLSLVSEIDSFIKGWQRYNAAYDHCMLAQIEKAESMFEADRAEFLCRAIARRAEYGEFIEPD